MTAALTTLLLFFSTVPVSVSQTSGPLPPNQEDLEAVLLTTAEAFDGLVRDYDATGELPTTTTLQSRSVVQGLEGKLEAYRDLHLAGLVEEVPLDDVDLGDLQDTEGFLSNRTYFASLSLADLGLGIDLSGILEKPMACASHQPEGGTPSTVFAFSASCSNDVQTSTRNLESRWDFQSDGDWDTLWSTQHDVMHQFASEGSWHAKLEIRDPDGNTNETTVSVVVKQPPTACFNVDPTSGTTQTSFRFDAGCSTDSTFAPATLQVRWDWEADGVPDTSWTTMKTASHSYETAGTWTARVQVRDQFELSDDATRMVSVSWPSGGGGGTGGPGVGGGTGRGTENPYAETGPDGPDGGSQPVQYNGLRSLDHRDGVFGFVKRWLQNLLSARQSAHGLTVLGTPVPETPVDDFVAFGTAEHVLFQRWTGGPYEQAADAEVRYAEGVSLRFAPLGSPVEALVELEWLRHEFGTFGSPEAFAVVDHQGYAYARLRDPDVLVGFKNAFQPITLGESDLFTLGHSDILPFSNQSAALHVQTLPGPVGVLMRYSSANGTVYFWRTEHRDSVSWRVSSPDWSTTHAVVNRSWLSGIGIPAPAFTNAAGESLGLADDGTLLIADNGTITGTNQTQSPWTLASNEPRSAVYESRALGEFWIVSDRRDGADEMISSQLAQAANPKTAFEVSATWTVVQQGNWQTAYPLVLSGLPTKTVAEAPGTAWVEYASRDAQTFQEPEYRLRFRDNHGRLLLDEHLTAPAGSYRLAIAFSPEDSLLKMSVAKADTFAVIASASVHVTSSKAFNFERVGFASGGANQTEEPAALAQITNLVTYVRSSKASGIDDLGESAAPTSAESTQTMSASSTAEIARYDGVISSSGLNGNTGTFITFSPVSGSSPVTVSYKYCYYANTNGATGTIRTVFDGVTRDSFGFTTPYTGGATCTTGNAATFAPRSFTVAAGVSNTIRFDWTNGDWRVAIANIVVTATSGGGGNVAPGTATQPSGPSSGQTGLTYSYSTSAHDDNLDNVRFEFSWGDGTINTYTGYVASDATASASHSWASAGTFNVAARAQDTPGGLWGFWSPARTVTISSSSGGDAYEPDNGFTQYTTITPSTTTQSQSRSINPAGDEDYLRFAATAGRTYTFYTEGTTDTYGHLYNAAQTQVQYDDDSGTSLNFLFSYTATSTENHYLRVRGYSSTTTGAYTLYYYYAASGSNNAPTPCFTSSPATGTTSTNFALDGSCSSDETPDASLQFRWDWDNNGWDTGWWTEYRTISHQWTTTGVKTVKMEVQDTSGLFSSTTGTVTVDGPPTACFTKSPSYGTTTTMFQFDGTCSSDPVTPDASLKFRWDWEGNGQWTSWSTDNRIVNHQFPTSGDRTVAMQVKDQADDVAATSGLVSIDNYPNPCFTVSPASGNPSTTFQVDGSCSTDDRTATGSLEVRWDFADNGWDTTWSTTKTASHQFGADGSHTMRMQVRDSPRQQVAATTQTVTVTSAAPANGLSSGFESGLNGWSSTGSGGTAFWHVSSRNKFTGTYSAYYGHPIDGNYYNNGNANWGTLTSPAFVVPAENPFLQFDTRYQTEGGTTYDRMTVEVVPSGGTASTLTLLNGVGNMQTWFKHHVSLASYAGQTITVRFRFDTVDHILNKFEGWYVDNIEVKASEYGVVVSTTAWNKSTVNAGSYSDEHHDDGTAETNALLNDDTDEALEFFNVQKKQDATGGSAWLGFWGQSNDCAGQAQQTHGVYVNGNLKGVFDPCAWFPTDQYVWKWWQTPLSTLANGANEFKIRPFCACARGLWQPVDTTSSGTWSDVKVDGALLNGELQWRLIVSQDQTYDTYERDITYTINEPGKAPRNEYEKEAYAYYNPVNLDSVAARIKLDANGNVQAKAWSSLKFRTNTVGAFSEGGMASYGLRVDGLCSATPSPPITKTPVSGQRYSVYYHEQETWTIGGAPVRSKYWLHLDSNPSTVSDQQSYTNGVRNPPASSSQTGDTDGNGYLALFTATQSLTTCQTSSNHGGSHPHQRYQLRIQLNDLDHRQQWDQASQKAGDVADWAKAGLELKNMDKPSLANIFLADKGTLVTWFFVAAQTGNVASATINEFDIGPVNGDPSSFRPGSRFNSFPSFVLTDVVLPGHLLRDSVQDFTETRSFP